MANLRDIAWLRKGCQEWNKRRTRCSNWRPDLSDVDISKCLKEKGPVTNCGKPDLRGYDLSNCNLEGSSLRDADLSGADLSGANLSCTELSGCKLWEAKFPRPEGASLPSKMVEFEEHKLICSVNDILHYVQKLVEHYTVGKALDSPMVFFRGESKEYCSLLPSVMRSNSLGKHPLRDNESDLLVELIRRRPEDFANEVSALGHLMIAQHYRLPTRLLDVSQNPLVSLFHACADDDEEDDHVHSAQLHGFVVPRSMVKPYTSHSVSVVANFIRLRRSEQNLLLTKTEEYTKKMKDIVPASYQTPLRSSPYKSAMARLVQFIKLEHSSFEERIDPRDFFKIFVVHPQQSFERIRAQSGAFLLSAFHERFDEKEVRKIKCGVPVYHQYIFKIPYKQKKTLMQQLGTLNITEETMYPGLEKSAKAVKRQYSG